MCHTAFGRWGISISSIVAGGWQAGREDWTGIDDNESIAAFRAAFDTAEEYAAGTANGFLQTLWAVTATRSSSPARSGAIPCPRRSTD